jgi:hypothetical protein
MASAPVRDELQRAWNRQETVPQTVEIVLTERLLAE